MERGVLALFGETSMAASDSLKSIVNQYNIPFYTWSYPKNDEITNVINAGSESSADSTETEQIVSTSNESPNFLLNMHPSLSPMLIFLMKYHRWQTIYYIYDNDEGFYFNILIVFLGEFIPFEIFIYIFGLVKA